MYCEKCGRKIDEGEDYCAACGTPVTTEIDIFLKVKQFAYNYRRQIAIMVVIVLILALGYMSLGKQGASQRDIKNQICKFENFDELESPMNIKKYIEYRRDTNKRAKYDDVWVAIVAENDYVQYMASYKLTYRLYNAGWEFDTLERVDDYGEYGYYDYIALDKLDANTVEEDLKDYYKDFIEQYRFNEFEFEIDLQPDDNSLKQRSINCKMVAESSEMSCNVILQANYILDIGAGWHLNETYLSDYTYSAKSEPSDELIKDALSMHPGEYTMDSKTKINSNNFQYVYKVVDTSSYSYMTVEWKVTLGAKYEMDRGWHIENVQSEIIDIDVDLAGQWAYAADGEYFNLTVEEVDDSKISYDFSVSFNETHVWGTEQTCTMSTDKIRTKNWQYTYDSEKNCISFVTDERIMNIGWCGGLSDKDYYLEYRAYANEENGKTGFYVDGRFIERK